MTPEQIQQMIGIIGGKKLAEKFGPPPPPLNPLAELGCMCELIIVGAICLGIMAMLS